MISFKSMEPRFLLKSLDKGTFTIMLNQVQSIDVARLRALDPRWIASVCGVAVRTARHWQRQGSLPLAPGRLLAIELGDLAALLGSEWSGWSFREGSLIDPAGDTWTPPAIRNVHNLRAALDATDAKLQRYETGVPVIDRNELARLQECADQAKKLVATLSRLYPVTSDDRRYPGPAPSIAVNQ